MEQPAQVTDLSQKRLSEEQQALTYTRQNGMVERAANIEEAMARCPFLGSMTLEEAEVFMSLLSDEQPPSDKPETTEREIAEQAPDKDSFTDKPHSKACEEVALKNKVKAQSEDVVAPVATTEVSEFVHPAEISVINEIAKPKYEPVLSLSDLQHLQQQLEFTSQTEPLLQALSLTKDYEAEPETTKLRDAPVNTLAAMDEGTAIVARTIQKPDLRQEPKEIMLATSSQNSLAYTEVYPVTENSRAIQAPDLRVEVAAGPSALEQAQPGHTRNENVRQDAYELVFDAETYAVTATDFGHTDEFFTTLAVEIDDLFRQDHHTALLAPQEIPVLHEITEQHPDVVSEPETDLANAMAAIPRQAEQIPDEIMQSIDVINASANKLGYAKIEDPAAKLEITPELVEALVVILEHAGLESPAEVIKAYAETHTVEELVEILQNRLPDFAKLIDFQHYYLRRLQQQLDDTTEPANPLPGIGSQIISAAHRLANQAA